MALTREEILSGLLTVFEENFEIESPDPDADLRESYEFDSIDAIELLGEIEKMLGIRLSQEEKKQAMGVRTIHQICDYAMTMMEAHS